MLNIAVNTSVIKMIKILFQNAVHKANVIHKQRRSKKQINSDKWLRLCLLIQLINRNAERFFSFHDGLQVTENEQWFNFRKV